jgi:hypothetical protein
MKQITINVPDKQYDFFLQLLKQLGFNKTKADDFVLTPAHKKILDEALRDMEENPEDEKDWNSIKKNFTAKLRKRK